MKIYYENSRKLIHLLIIIFLIQLSTSMNKRKLIKRCDRFSYSADNLVDLFLGKLNLGVCKMWPI